MVRAGRERGQRALPRRARRPAWRSSSTRRTPPATRAGCCDPTARSRATPGRRRQPLHDRDRVRGRRRAARGRRARRPSTRPARALIAEIAARWEIPLDREHVIGHREMFAAKDCPGNLDVERLIAEARDFAARAAGPAVACLLPARNAAARPPGLPRVGGRARGDGRRARRRQHRRDGRAARGRARSSDAAAQPAARAGYAGWDDGDEPAAPARRRRRARARLDPLPRRRRADRRRRRARRCASSSPATRSPGVAYGLELYREWEGGSRPSRPHVFRLFAHDRPDHELRGRAPPLQPGADRDPALGLDADDDPRPAPRFARASGAPAAQVPRGRSGRASRPERPPPLPRASGRAARSSGRRAAPASPCSPAPRPARGAADGARTGRARPRLPAAGAQRRGRPAAATSSRVGALRRRGRRPRRRQHRRDGGVLEASPLGRPACCATRAATPTPAGTTPPTASGCSTPRSSSAPTGSCSSTPTSGSTPTTPPRCGRSSTREADPGSAYGFRVHRMIDDGGELRPGRTSGSTGCSPRARASGCPRSACTSCRSRRRSRAQRWQKTTVRIQHSRRRQRRAARRRASQVRGGRPEPRCQRDYASADPRAGHDRGPGSPRPPGLPVLADPLALRRRASTSRTLDLDAPVLSAIVIARDDEATIERAVRSVVEQECPLPFEVIVVVSGSPADGRDRAASASATGTAGRARRTRRCPGKARNAGLAVARGEYVSFPGSHVELAAGQPRRALRAHERGYAMVTGSIVNGNPTPAGWASYFLDHSSALPGRPSGGARRRPGALLVRARVPARRSGGFPEDLRAGEDTVVNQELWRRGYRAYREATIELIHRSPCSTIRRRWCAITSSAAARFGRILRGDFDAVDAAAGGSAGCASCARYPRRRLASTDCAGRAVGRAAARRVRAVAGWSSSGSPQPGLGTWFELLRPARRSCAPSRAETVDRRAGRGRCSPSTIGASAVDGDSPRRPRAGARSSPAGRRRATRSDDGTGSGSPSRADRRPRCTVRMPASRAASAEPGRPVGVGGRNHRGACR